MDRNLETSDFDLPWFAPDNDRTGALQGGYLPELAESPLPSSSDGSAFMTGQGEPSSELAEIAVSLADVAKERVVLLLSRNPDMAHTVLLDVRKNGTIPSGWCVLSTMAPTKASGYIQVSAMGANKFATLEELCLWSTGRTRGPRDDCSHLCGQPSCTLPGHIVSELAQLNQIRKGCIVWVYCPHAECRLARKVIVVCPHQPHCIKYCEDYASYADFLERGICNDVGSEVRQRDNVGAEEAS